MRGGAIAARDGSRQPSYHGHPGPVCHPERSLGWDGGDHVIRFSPQCWRVPTFISVANHIQPPLLSPSMVLPILHCAITNWYQINLRLRVSLRALLWRHHTEAHGEKSVVGRQFSITHPHIHSLAHLLIHSRASHPPNHCIPSSSASLLLPLPSHPQHIEALQRADCDRQCYCGTVDSGTL